MVRVGGAYFALRGGEAANGGRSRAIRAYRFDKLPLCAGCAGVIRSALLLLHSDGGDIAAELTAAGPVQVLYTPCVLCFTPDALRLIPPVCVPRFGP
jgi:hypothetical protein